MRGLNNQIQIGQVYGRLTVTGFIMKDKRWQVQCKCSCGNETVNRAKYLIEETVYSCGCGRIDEQRLSPGIAACNEAMRQYVHNAKTRGIEWTLDKEQFKNLCLQPCYYCGIENSMIKGHRIGLEDDRKRYNGDFIHNGIDRTDNNLGYTLSNCVPCCRTCNRMKLAMSVETFINVCKTIAKKFS